MSPQPLTKRKLSAAEAKAQKAVRLVSIRLQIAIYRALDERDITSPAAIGAALGLLTVEATALLARKHLRQGDMERLEAAAARLELPE